MGICAHNHRYAAAPACFQYVGGRVLLLAFVVPNKSEGEIVTTKNSLDQLRKYLHELQISFPDVKTGVTGQEALNNDEMSAVISALEQAEGAGAATTALRASMQGVRENRTISWDEVPTVTVCRTCGAIQLGEPGACPACGADPLTLRQVTPIWFFDPLTPAETLEALESGPAALRAYVDGLSEAQLNHPPEPGEWSLRETLWHVLVAEQLFAGRVQKLLTEDNPLLSGMASWAVTSPDGLTTRDILDRLVALRTDTLARLRGMAAGDWWRTGFHEEWGQVTLLQQAVYFARHERSHYAQLAGARRAAERAG